MVGGLPFYAILSLPILFAAGMSLFDTIDGCFMNFAYDWAFSKPVRKVYYNLTITGLSVFVALFIGTVEMLGLLGQEANLSGSVWTFFENFNINTAGFVIVGVFVVTWVVALSIWHFGQHRSEVGRRRATGARGAAWRWTDTRPRAFRRGAASVRAGNQHRVWRGAVGGGSPGVGGR